MECGPSTDEPRAAGSLRRWFLVLTKPVGEALAKTNLERQGYHVYCPRLLRAGRYRGRWVERVVALFPRYLFVQVELGRQSLAPVRSTLGVSCLVRSGTQPTIVPDGLVDELIGREDPQSGLHRLASGRSLAPGEPVRVVGGSLDGVEGVFEREEGASRVVVLLRLLGREAPVRIPACFVVPSMA
jgi:transcriptional antiterminator RfaH